MFNKLFEKCRKLWALEGCDLSIGSESGRAMCSRGTRAISGVGYRKVIEAAGKARDGVFQESLVPIVQFEFEDAPGNLPLRQRSMVGFVWIGTVAHSPGAP